MSEILVIGDDLTGTNATASTYARDGLRAVTVLDPTAPAYLDDSIQVVACSTGSRHMTPARAAQTVDAIVRNYGHDVRAIVKRVDTTLRGNIGAEIEATLTAAKAMHPEQQVCGLVVPGFPAAHRTTIGGYQLLDGEPILMGPASHDPFTPVRHSSVADIIHEQTLLTTINIGLDIVMGDTSTLTARLAQAAQNAELVIVDSVTDGDQQRIATAAGALESDERSWVVFESGPFGAIYAHALGIRPHVDRANPILALIGSPTDLTRLQSDRLEGQPGVDLITIDDPASDVSQLTSRLQASAEAGNTVVGIRTTSRGGSAPDPLHASQMLALIIDLAVECADSMPFDGIYASGGDVAFAVLDAFGARGYEVENEVVPLAVSGKLIGGPPRRSQICHQGWPRRRCGRGGRMHQPAPKPSTTIRTANRVDADPSRSHHQSHSPRKPSEDKGE